MSDRSGPLTAVETLFEPRTVAVVGASPTDPVRSQVLRNFVNLKSPTEVMAVNPRYEEVLGFPCYASLRDLPRCQTSSSPRWGGRRLCRWWRKPPALA